MVLLRGLHCHLPKRLEEASYILSRDPAVQPCLLECKACLDVRTARGARDAKVVAAVDRAARRFGRLDAVFFGDEVFAERRFVEALCKPGRSCAAAATAGDGWGDALGRAWMMCGVDADVALLSFGAADLRRGARVEHVIAAARKTLSYLQQCGGSAVPVVVGLLPHEVSWSGQWSAAGVNAELARVTGDLGVVFCDARPPLDVRHEDDAFLYYDDDGRLNDMGTTILSDVLGYCSDVALAGKTKRVYSATLVAAVFAADRALLAVAVVLLAGLVLRCPLRRRPATPASPPRASRTF